MGLKDYIKPRGKAAELAQALGVPSSLISQWTAETGARQIPVERCSAIERATAGAVRCEEMRADVLWFRVGDPGWPWHPAGRPLIDVARTMQAPQEARDAA